MWTNKVPTTPLWAWLFFWRTRSVMGCRLGNVLADTAPEQATGISNTFFTWSSRMCRGAKCQVHLWPRPFDEKKRTCYWVSVIQNLLSLLSSHPVIFSSVASLPCASLSTCQRLSTSMDRSSEDQSPSKDHRTRRAHKKSRYGCSKCRERRIKVWKRVWNQCVGPERT